LHIVALPLKVMVEKIHLHSSRPSADIGLARRGWTHVRLLRIPTRSGFPIGWKSGA
jgi:hypothetical protein